MSCRVCVIANSTEYLRGGALMWMYINWILGFRELGCEVYWLDNVSDEPTKALQQVETLRRQLQPYGLADSIAVWPGYGGQVPASVDGLCRPVDDVTDADLLVSMRYSVHAGLVGRFRRAVIIDTDPGLLQTWIRDGDVVCADYDRHFTIGENLQHAHSQLPDLGITWQLTRACVTLSAWPVCPAEAPGAFTTISHWSSKDWFKQDGQWISNEKRTAFLPFLDLPRLTSQPLELAVPLREEDEGDRKTLLEKGWRLADPYAVASTPADARRYIQSSRGEFSCAKPMYVRFQNAWVSDRTVCYLASGKPAVVQHTGPSSYLPEDGGLFRFRTIEEAAHSLEAIAGDYEHQCRLARAVAEEFFDSRKVVKELLERAL